MRTKNSIRALAKKSAIGEWIFHHPVKPEHPVPPDAAYGRMKILLKQADLPDRESARLQAEKPPVSDFVPFVGKVRKPGTGCITMINDRLFEGRFTPTNADGKRISKNIYAPTREECEEKLAELIVQMKAEIAEEKARRKAELETA